VHGAVIGQGQRGLAQPLGALHQLLDPAQAVEQGELVADDALVDAGYAAVFLTLAWLRLRNKDVTS